MRWLACELSFTALSASADASRQVPQLLAIQALASRFSAALGVAYVSLEEALALGERVPDRGRFDERGGARGGARVKAGKMTGRRPSSQGRLGEVGRLGEGNRVKGGRTAATHTGSRVASLHYRRSARARGSRSASTCDHAVRHHAAAVHAVVSSIKCESYALRSAVSGPAKERECRAGWRGAHQSRPCSSTERHRAARRSAAGHTAGRPRSGSIAPKQ